MSYAAAVDHLNSLGLEFAPTPPTAPDAPPAPRRKFDIAHMRALAAALGDPQNTFPSVLLAGTNGKGSTAATLASILAAAGYRTALYTSPHLVRVNERIQVTIPVDPTEYAAGSKSRPTSPAAPAPAPSIPSPTTTSPASTSTSTTQPAPSSPPAPPPPAQLLRGRHRLGLLPLRRAARRHRHPRSRPRRPARRH